MLYCLLLPPASKGSRTSARQIFKSRAIIDGQLPLGRSGSALTHAPDDISTFGDVATDIAKNLRNAALVDLVISFYYEL